MRGLGIFFIILGIAGGVIGAYNYSPSKNEVLDAEFLGREAERIREANAVNDVLKLQGRSSYLVDVPIPDAEMEANLSRMKGSREMTMYVSFGAGGLLLVTGLICTVAGKPAKT